MEQKNDFIEAVARWNKVHRIIGSPKALSGLWDESVAAIRTFGNKKQYSAMIDVGAGSGILGIPWMVLGGGKCLFVEPSAKKAAFLTHFLASRFDRNSFMVIVDRLEHVARETADQFFALDYFLASRAFSTGGGEILSSVFQKSSFFDKDFYIFTKANESYGLVPIQRGLS